MGRYEEVNVHFTRYLSSVEYKSGRWFLCGSGKYKDLGAGGRRHMPGMQPMTVVTPQDPTELLSPNTVEYEEISTLQFN